MSHPPQDAYNLPLPFGLHRITQALNALGTLLIIGLMLLINTDIVGRTEVRYRDFVKLTHRFRLHDFTEAFRTTHHQGETGAVKLSGCRLSPASIRS